MVSDGKIIPVAKQSKIQKSKIQNRVVLIC